MLLIRSGILRKHLPAQWQSNNKCIVCKDECTVDYYSFPLGRIALSLPHVALFGGLDGTTSVVPFVRSGGVSGLSACGS